MNSGQNPIEPARLGCKIFHGPNVSNFTEIYEYLKTLDVTKKVNDFDELGLSLVEEFKDEKAKNDEITTNATDGATKSSHAEESAVPTTNYADFYASGS